MFIIEDERISHTHIQKSRFIIWINIFRRMEPPFYYRTPILRQFYIKVKKTTEI